MDDFPAIKWGSNTDVSGRFPAITCRRLEEPLPGSSLNGWLSWLKIAKLIEELPF
jgi:hypothetical protein